MLLGISIFSAFHRLAWVALRVTAHYNLTFGGSFIVCLGLAVRSEPGESNCDRARHLKIFISLLRRHIYAHTQVTPRVSALVHHSLIGHSQLGSATTFPRCPDASPPISENRGRTTSFRDRKNGRGEWLRSLTHRVCLRPPRHCPRCHPLQAQLHQHQPST